MRTPKRVTLSWPRQYRIIPSEFPPVNFFEQLVEPELMDELYLIESLTNDRLRDEVGDLNLVAPAARISGPGASPVMAAFTHVSTERPSRYSDGSYGMYYAAKTLETAIEETKYHRSIFLAATHQAPGEIDMRVYVGQVLKPLHDVRGTAYGSLRDPDDWTPSQAFGLQMRDAESNGLVYGSVRDPGGECIAAFKPTSVSIPKQGPHLGYVWDGADISRVYKKTLLS